MSKVGKINKFNELKHGEVLALRLMQQMVAGFMSLATHEEYLTSLIQKMKDDKDVKLTAYYEMMAMFIHEFKLVADKDPQIADIKAEGERQAFLASLGVPGGNDI